MNAFSLSSPFVASRSPTRSPLFSMCSYTSSLFSKSPGLRGRTWTWTCGTVCPAAGPSCMAYVSDVAPKCGSTHVPTFLARLQRSVVSSGVRSANRATTRRETTSTCPGTTGLRLTKPRDRGVS